MKTFAVGAACLVALAMGLGLAVAEGSEGQRPSKWWQNPVCKSRVGLKDAQTAEIERIFQSVRDELRAEKAELERQEAMLSRLLAESNDDEAVVVRTIDRVEAARSALAKTRTLMLYRMHRLLSPDQRARLDAFEREQAQAAEASPGSSRPRE
ncbi:periplasmic heavy metal sensor [Luteitalea sp.]|jgi:Spy/CpxP family protein refolding chaperone|uniref:Spy/CpxP family protein refolding chaperone n=1 Tax=Luteitalea sp. TaxID=2004800 RepID=UPI0025B878C4|nr:periplasmic heavy metal sensor [Luteitalea sp.]